MRPQPLRSRAIYPILSLNGTVIAGSTRKCLGELCLSTKATQMTFATGTARAPHLLTTLLDRLSELPAVFYEYQRKREIYLRTLRELESYRPHELADLRIAPSDIEPLARQQAGF